MARELVEETLVTWTTPKAGAIRELGYSGAVEVFHGPLVAHVANAAEVYGELPIDRVLKGFRVRRGAARSRSGAVGLG